MKLFTTIAVFLPAATTAAPSALSTRAVDELCAPTSYTLSDYVLVTSNASASVSFKFESEFTLNAPAEDLVQNGLTCDASGPVIPNNNECTAASGKTRELLFDLRAPQDQSHYQISHTWRCNGTTWMSGNNVKVPTQCQETSPGTIKCVGTALRFVPQNVRKLCQTPTC